MRDGVVIHAPYIDQSGTYPTGCESVSTVMLLRFLGFDITVDQFIQVYLKKEEFEKRDGVLYGPDPHICFCGNPYDENGFGCYAPVIVSSLNKVLKEMGVQKKEYVAADETGTPTEELLHKYIDRGMPVIYWASINMSEPTWGPQWRLHDTGELFTWVSNEHCMLLVGYDEEGYYFNDPYGGNGRIRYPRSIVEKRHFAQYMQAVSVQKATKIKL